MGMFSFLSDAGKKLMGKGDTLWGISTDFYKDGAKYLLIVEANLEVIKDADKIYTGQSIRIPSLA